MKGEYRRLGTVERTHVCDFMRFLVPFARDPAHPMRVLARTQLAHSVWRWTADAVDVKGGFVKQDAFKYDVGVHPATRAAIAQVSERKLLRHEHAVPRMAIADRIIHDDLSSHEIYALLERLAVAVIVTVAEDKQLRPKNNMPAGWDWSTGDPYARYRSSGLYGQLVFPIP